jgi:hypothetical protein
MKIYRVLIREENTGIRRLIRAERLSFKVKITLVVQVVQVLFLYPAWALDVWVKAPRFGSQPECNHLVKYVFLFVNIRATAKWIRGLSIFAFSTIIAGSLPLLAIFLKARHLLYSSGEIEFHYWSWLYAIL